MIIIFLNHNKRDSSHQFQENPFMFSPFKLLYVALTNIDWSKLDRTVSNTAHIYCNSYFSDT